MDKCTYCAGGGGPEVPGSVEEYEKYGANRLVEGKLPLCAEMCSTKSLLAGDGEIIAQIYKERVIKRGYGSGAWGWMTAYHEGDRGVSRHARRQGDRMPMSIDATGERAMTGSVARARFIARRACGRCVMLLAHACAARSTSRGRSIRTRAWWTSRRCCASSRASKGASTFPIRRASVLDTARRADLGSFPRGDAALVRRDRDPRHASPCWRPPISSWGGSASRPADPGARYLRFKASSGSPTGSTAVSFVILGLTGLNITFGKLVLLPLIGPDAFTASRKPPSTCTISRALRS